MSYNKVTSECVFCGGIVKCLQIKNHSEIESTCTSCGYELFTKGGKVKSLPKETVYGGYGTYHVHYKNGDKTFGCFPKPVTGKDVEDFLRFIDDDPSVDSEACSLIRNDKGTLEAIVGQLPPLFEEIQRDLLKIAGAIYA